MNTYFCKSCGTQATKPACRRFVDPKSVDGRSLATLGTWSCPKCGKHAKVARSKAKVAA